MFNHFLSLKKWLRFTISLIFLGFSSTFADLPKTLRIGYQPYGTLILVKGRGQLGSKLSSLGTKVEWVEFGTGIAMSGAFSENQIDFIGVGEVPPVFMQSAQIPFVYIGHEPPSPQSEAMVVLKDSPILTLADLKGKKIALSKGTNVHFLLFKILEKAGITENDLQIIYLPPDQGRKALENKEIDAWVIWDPFLAAAQQELEAKILIDGTGLVAGRQFYLARRTYVEQNPKVINIVLEELRRIGTGIQQNPNTVAKFLAARINLSPLALGMALNRMNTGVQLMDPKTIATQQEIADLFHQKGFINKLLVKEVLWKTQED